MALAATTKCRRLGGLNNGSLFSRSFGSLEVQDQGAGIPFLVRDFSSWLANDSLLGVSSRGRERETGNDELSGGSS